MPTIGEALLWLLTRADADTLQGAFTAKCLGCGHDCAIETVTCPVCGMSRFRVSSMVIDLAALPLAMEPTFKEPLTELEPLT